MQEYRHGLRIRHISLCQEDFGTCSLDLLQAHDLLTSWIALVMGM
jgi:hypothetical protein